jgi:hypothetical protein
MTAGEHLAKYGVSVAQAREFIVANLNSPTVIYNTAKQYGVTNQMLAEIYGGVTANDVRSFFNQLGLAAADLDSKVLMAPAPQVSANTVDFSANNKFFKFNDETGVLSTEAIRQMVLDSGVTLDKYYRSFDLKKMVGGADGIDAKDFLGKVPLDNPFYSELKDITFNTAEQYESLRIGTIINFIQAIDLVEIAQLEQFFITNRTPLENNDSQAWKTFSDLFLSIFIDEAPVDQAWLNEEQVAIVAAEHIDNFVFDHSFALNNSYEFTIILGIEYNFDDGLFYFS